MAAKIRPVQVTHGDVDAARDLHIDFETSSRTVKKL